MARKQFTASVFEKKHQQNIGLAKIKLNNIYNSMYKEAALIGVGTGFDDPDREFYLSDFPNAEAKIDALLRGLSAKVESLISDGTDSAWELSYAKNEAMVESLAQYFKMSKEDVNEWSRRSIDALESFRERTVNGMNLSERVWDFVKNDKQQLEYALELGLAQGKSAAALSRDVREYLQNPDKLFRRVRDKDGNLRLSKAAQAYHPGQGVYRSSYKNALRMTITETNMAYRSADNVAWSDMPFVIGQTIKLSNNHTCKGVEGKFFDICDEMQGDYPKEFKFTGWHPHCRCYVIAKLADREELSKFQRMSDEEKANYKFKGTVEDVPKGYKDWMQNNAERIENAKNLPYFIKDNYVGGKVEGGLNWNPNSKLSIKERAKLRHENRTQDDVDALQRKWNMRRIENKGEGYTVKHIEGFIGNYGVDRKYLDELLIKPLTYDSKNWEFPELNKLYEKYKDLADINSTKAAMVRGELFGTKLQAMKLGAKGQKYADRIARHIDQIDRRKDSVAYWLSAKETQQLQSAKDKVAAMKAHREEVLKAWNERKLKTANSTADAFIERISNATTAEELTKLMGNSRYAKAFDLGDMPMEYQKTVATTAVRMSTKWGLDPIDIRLKMFPKKDSNTFMWAHGGMVEANSAYWSKGAIKTTMEDSFNNCVTKWGNSLNNRLKHKQSYLKSLNEVNDGSAFYSKEIKKTEKAIKELEAMISTGMNRHNVFLSPETMLRDCFTHETGHTVHDQILGGLNGHWYRKRMYNAADASVLDEELKQLWKKHKKTGGGWLSEYGLKNHKEFMSESMVLYTHAPEKLPADVRAWFDLLGEHAKAGKLPARDKMPSVAFKPAKKAKAKAVTHASMKLSMDNRKQLDFDPFSDEIESRLQGIKDKDHRNKFFESIVSDSRAKVINETDKAVTTVFDGHKSMKGETWKNTKGMAVNLNDKGISVCFLPERENITSADAIIQFKDRWMLADFKCSQSLKTNTIQIDIAHAFEQADCCVIKVQKADKGILCNALDYLVRNNMQVGDLIVINKLGGVKLIPKKDVQSRKYSNILKGFLK